MCCFPYLPRFAAKCCILENGVHLLAQDTYVNVHIGNKNTQFAVFCIYPTSKEKGADIHCITAFFMLTTRFTFLMTISPISIERYNQYCLHNMPSVFCLLIETTKQPLRRECIDKRTRINLTHDSARRTSLLATTEYTTLRHSSL